MIGILFLILAVSFAAFVWALDNGKTRYYMVLAARFVIAAPFAAVGFAADVTSRAAERVQGTMLAAIKWVLSPAWLDHTRHKNPRTLDYLADVVRDEGGDTWCATFPDFPGTEVTGQPSLYALGAACTEAITWEIDENPYSKIPKPPTRAALGAKHAGQIIVSVRDPRR